MGPIYLKPGLQLSLGGANDPASVRALQHDLRALGYLTAGIDGNFGPKTAQAIRAIQNDLLQALALGRSSQATRKISDFNDDGTGAKRVNAISGVLDQGLAACLADILADPAIAPLPCADDAVVENAKALQAIEAFASPIAPTPFIVAIVRQESEGRHFNQPPSGDEDSFVTIGLDRNDPTNSDHITSRGYGIGQYTFFYHPLSSADIAGYVADPVLNVRNAFSELRDKFNGFVLGPADRADDRLAEHPALPLRLCKYQPSDPLYMRDCKACAQAVRKVDLTRGTPFYEGAVSGLQPDQYYPSAEYAGVPDRAQFLCDWPYAARRYNGSGNNSYHYQARILLNLLR